MPDPENFTAMSPFYTAPFTPPESPATADVVTICPSGYEPRIVEYVGETNGYMSGAVGEGDQEFQLPDNDATVCLENLDDQFKYMPFRLVSARELVEIEGLLDNSLDALHVLTEEFWTTIYGLRCAFRECQGVRVREGEHDTVVLGALARRGGLFDRTSNVYGDVLYPEHLTPIIGEHERIYDKEYWDVIFAQGELWKGLKQNRVYPRYSGVNAWLK